MMRQQTKVLVALTAIAGMFVGRAAADEKTARPAPDVEQVQSAVPQLEQTVLFQARQGGYHSYRIPGLTVTSSGMILAYCEARKDNPWDYGDIDLLLRRSTDRGKTWSAPTNVVDQGRHAAHNAVLIADRASKDVHFLYCVDYLRCFYCKSTDEGATFGKPVEITSVFEEYRREYDWKLIATGPGHGLRLASGRLLVPAWLSTSKEQRPTMSSVIYSDDGGQHWNRGPMVVRDGDGQGIENPMEPILVELQNGRVMFNVRNASKPERRAISISPDGVRDWSPFRFDPGLREPFCMASLCSMPSRPSEPFAPLVWANPDNLTRSGQPGTANVGGHDRKRLTIKLSTDEGKTWPVSRVLEPSWSGYSHLATDADRSIYCLYESGCINNMMWDVRAITFAKFNRSWLTEPTVGEAFQPAIQNLRSTTRSQGEQ